MICLFPWLLTIFFSLFWSSSFCFSCHAVSSADVFCLSVSFILSIRSRSSFSSFPHQINHVSHLRFLVVRMPLTESQNVTFIIVSSAYLLSARFFSALDLDKDEIFSWYFSRALSLISFFSSLSEITCTSWYSVSYTYGLQHDYHHLITPSLCHWDTVDVDEHFGIWMFLPAVIISCSHSLDVFFGKLKNTVPFPTLAVLLTSSTGSKRKTSNRYGG